MAYIKKYYVKGKCKCEKCGETFEVNDEYITYCPNNCCAVKVGIYSSNYSITEGKSNCYKIIERHVTYNPTYYVSLNDNVLNFIDKIKNEKDFDLFCYLAQDINSDDTTYINYIELEFSTLCNSVNERNNFITKINCTYCNKDTNSNEEILNKLIEFYKLYINYKSGIINLETSNRKELQEKYDYDMEQLKAYDYTFYI